MGVFGWISNLFGSSASSDLLDDLSTPRTSEGLMDMTGQNHFDDFAVNPANGLPMVGGMAGLDVEGNPFGTDFSHDSHDIASNDWMGTSGTSISNDDW